MFLLQWSNPKIVPATIKLSTKYNQATESDMEKANTIVANYTDGCNGVHKLVLNPKMMSLLVSLVDASYAEHPDSISHSKGVVGFKSDTSWYFHFLSSK